jgi:bifunctional UDP-N-acetylglucosamine pyrophosphorylase / glucosamine-1-phosphate N-acetyltransferase
MSATAAIILAAGKGTRMKSDKAKVIFELAGKPMIQRVVDTAARLDCERICVVVGHQKESVIGILEDNPNLVFADQAEQLGTGHAIIIAKEQFNGFEGDILILAGDVPLLKSETLKDLLDHHRKTGAACTVLTAVLEDAGKYGRIIRDSALQVIGIVEYKDASEEQRKIREFNTGIWCFNSSALFDSIHKISNDNAQKEYYLTDTLAILFSQGQKVEALITGDLAEVSGINSQEQLAELEKVYLAGIKTCWLNNGVMIHNPDTVYIGEEVEIETDVTIESHSIVRGKCYLEKGCHIGPHCYIEDSDIGRETILQGYNIVIDANVHEGEIIPWGERILEETMFQE